MVIDGRLEQMLEVEDHSWAYYILSQYGGHVFDSRADA
jgi:hypothetical protein